MDGDGFKIKGQNAYWTAAAAGDANGDGKGDIIVGTPYSDYCCGNAYVVFGKRDAEQVRLADLGRRGYRIRGVEDGSALGNSVAGIGDVNLDGRADVVVGVPGANDEHGLAVIAYGKAGSRTIPTDNLGSRGYRIVSTVKGAAGWDVAGVGDVNGDNLPDILIGTGRNSAYLVWGRP